MPRQPYDPAEIEPRWQAWWERDRTFRTPGPGDPDFDPARPKFYILDMFPYPSGAGLHVGHPEGYTATDILARYRRQRGHNVLHPMGWDAFGLPAKQYAIQTGTHPAVTTRKNIDTFRRQIKRLGFSYDWDREVDTTDPRYYRWTQWIFARLFEKGLAYMAEVPVWWCDALGTVLANEEVIDGKSERGNHPCVRKPMRQWMLRITAYAERLLEDLAEVDWPDSIKAMQREWIGRSEGAEVDFPVLAAQGGETGEKIRVFTTRPDTLFGATWLVLSPEHPQLARLVAPERAAEVKAYQDAAARKTDLDRTDLSREKTGVFTGAYARNPVFAAENPRSRIPIWIADYVVMGYGTGAIMAVPAHDERDFAFAKRFGLEVACILDPLPPIGGPASGGLPEAGHGDPELRAKVLAGDACWTGDGVFIASRNSEVALDGLRVAEGKQRIIQWLAQSGIGSAKVTYRLRDWLFSRQRYWGEPFPILHVEGGGVQLVPDEDLPVLLPEMEDFRPSGKAEPPLGKATHWVHTRTRDGRLALRETNTMPQWAGSCWYYLRFIDPHEDGAPFAPEKERYWMPVDLYVGGAEHAVLHLLYARFWHKVLFDLGLVSTKEPFRKLFNQGMILAHGYRDRRGAVVAAEEVVDREGKLVHAGSGEAVTRITAKMSKSEGNVVNPDAVIEEYGADTFRLYEMFMGPLEATKPWSPADIPGVHRFLSRVWRLVVPEFTEAGWIHAWLADAGRAGSPDVERSLHRMIRKVTLDLDRMAFNTAISAMMVFVNDALKAAYELSRSQVERFLQVLAPFAPHLAEELWKRLGNEPVERPLSREPWPAFEAALVAEATVEIPVQVNGKLRGRVEVPAGADQLEILSAARAAVSTQLGGRQVVKEIVVPGKLVNFVVKG